MAQKKAGRAAEEARAEMFAPPEPFLQRDLEAYEAEARKQTDAVRKALHLKDDEWLPDGIQRRVLVAAAAALGWVRGVRTAEDVRNLPPRCVATLAVKVAGLVKGAGVPDPEACWGQPGPQKAAASPRES